MTTTRPSSEQLLFRSAATGDHVLDDYLEAAEAGGRELSDLIGELFDTDGALAAFSFRHNATSNDIEYRIGTGAWTAIGDFSSFVTLVQNWATQTGSTVDGTDYSAKHHALAAATSATNAATSATTAGTHATNAGTAATDAQTAQTAAETAATDAQTAQAAAEAAALPAQAGHNGKLLTTDGSAASWTDPPTTLPDQTGHADQVLTTNGTTADWAALNGLPDQTGHADQFLRTDGTTADWAAIPSGGSVSLARHFLGM